MLVMLMRSLWLPALARSQTSLCSGARFGRQLLHGRTHPRVLARALVANSCAVAPILACWRALCLAEGATPATPRGGGRASSDVASDFLVSPLKLGRANSDVASDFLKPGYKLGAANSDVATAVRDIAHDVHRGPKGHASTSPATSLMPRATSPMTCREDSQPIPGHRQRRR